LQIQYSQEILKIPRKIAIFIARFSARKAMEYWEGAHGVNAATLRKELHCALTETLARSPPQSLFENLVVRNSTLAYWLPATGYWKETSRHFLPLPIGTRHGNRERQVATTVCIRSDGNTSLQKLEKGSAPTKNGRWVQATRQPRPDFNNDKSISAKER
jgi:hypothetical protein